jgi:hypothetical protein
MQRCGPAVSPGLALGVLLAVTTPAAQPTDPPTIIDVRSQSRVCTAIKERVGPSVAVLLQNDRTILDGVVAMQEMGVDAGTPRLQMDELHLENDVARIVRNLAAIDALLAQPERLDTKGEDARTIETMKEVLRAVAGQQLATLNALDGTLESAQADQFRDNSSIPDFANNELISSASAGANLSTPVALSDTRMTADVGSTTPTPAPAAPRVEPPPKTAGDFFPELARSEAQAGRIVATVAAGCQR